MDSVLAGFPFDPDRAREILDNAGFIDTDGDGFRENPDDSRLTLTFGVAEGGNNHFMAAQMMQDWADIGIHVELYQWRMQEHANLIHMMTNDADLGAIFGNTAAV